MDQPETPNPLLLLESVPVSCKGKKDLLGRPLLWNDVQQRCRPLTRRFRKKMHDAQKASAEGIAASQQAHVGLKSHQVGSVANRTAAEAHAHVAQEFHKAGFSSVAQVHAKQAMHHAQLTQRHDKHHAKETGTAPPASSESTSASATSPKHGHRDHRGRFHRKQ